MQKAFREKESLLKQENLLLILMSQFKAFVRGSLLRMLLVYLQECL